MWLIIKYNLKEFDVLKKKLLEKIDNEMFLYRPQIMKNSTNNLSKKNLRKNILGNYAIIYSKKVIERKNIFEASRTVGLTCILDGFKNNQTQIEKFVNHCKNNQDNDGCLKNSFFNFSNLKDGTFENGPLVKYIFRLIEEQKKKIKFLVNNKSVIIRKNCLLATKAL